MSVPKSKRGESVYDALNPGQKNQILKNDAVKKLFDRYKVNIGGIENA